MSKEKHPRAAAMEVATALFNELKPFTLTTPPICCSEWLNSNLISVVGSLRRCKPEVSDIEILFVPRILAVQDGLFDAKDVDQVALKVEKLLAAGVLAKRPNVNGHFCWGPQNKHAIHVESGIPVDLFTTTADNWWVSLVIRTGSKETNLKLTTGAQQQGATLNAYGQGITWADGTQTRATSEKHLFELCKVPYKDARDR